MLAIAEQTFMHAMLVNLMSFYNREQREICVMLLVYNDMGD
jgi:hypothetical protein